MLGMWYLGEPVGLSDFFTLKSPIPLAGFTLVDSMMSALGRGALLRAVLRKP
jgi:hypothetical protein